MAVNPHEAAQHQGGGAKGNEEIGDPRRPGDEGSDVLTPRKGRMEPRNPAPSDEDHNPGRERVSDAQEEVSGAERDEALEKIDSCIECHLVSGGYDYLAKFVTSGIVDYQNIIESLIDRDVGVDKYFSFVVIKTPFVKTQIPLTRLFAERS